MLQFQHGNLVALLAQVPGPRDRAGRRHPLFAMLAQACCTVLYGFRGYAVIVR